MGDHGRPIEFGLSLVPNAAELAEARELAVRADGLGLDLLGSQDHPYQWRFLETWMLMADLLARTERLRVFPDVTDLPLRQPARAGTTQSQGSTPVLRLPTRSGSGSALKTARARAHRPLG